MKENIHSLSVDELRELFIQQSRLFILALESGESFEELDALKDSVKYISALIEKRDSTGRGKTSLVREDFSSN